MTDLTIEQAELLIGEPARDWTGRCYEIAAKLALSIGGKAVYGHWLGAIMPDTHFAPRAHIGWVSHGWILMPDGSVIDPTQWVFFGDEPYIFHGEVGDQYDRGGQRFREQLLQPPPEWNANEDQYDCHRLSAEATEQLRILLGDDIPWSDGQLRWVANLPIAYLNGHEVEIYTELNAVGLGAAIPLDHQIEAGVDHL